MGNGLFSLFVMLITWSYRRSFFIFFDLKLRLELLFATIFHVRFASHYVNFLLRIIATSKGLCHEMNNFLKVLNIKSVLSVYALIVFNFFCCFVMEKIKDKVLACF